MFATFPCRAQLSEIVRNTPVQNDKGERIEREVVLPRQERPKGNERGNKEAGRDKDKTPARRHRGLGHRGSNPTRPEIDE